MPPDERPTVPEPDKIVAVPDASSSSGRIVARDPDTGDPVDMEDLLSRVADRSAKIAFLQEMTGALARAESLGELLDRTAAIAQRHLPYEVCSTHLVDPQTAQITVVLGSGPLFETVGTRQLRIGEGVVGWVVQNGKLANVPDVREDPRYIQSATRIRAELAVPIRARGRTVGVFNLESTEVRAFTAYDEQIFSILAAHIGASLERVELYREALERARRLAALNQIARAIAAPLELERIFDVVADELHRLIPHDRTSLAIHLPDTGEMQIVGVRGLADQPSGLGMRFAPSRMLMRTERPLLLRTEDSDSSARDRLVRLGLASYVAVPIRLEGEFVAQLNLAWKGEPTLAEGGLEFLSALGSHLAVVLKNARLYEQLGRSDAKLLRTQDELIQSAKLAAVGELAAGVAHELNNPLTGILGYTQWVLLEVEKSAEQEPIRTRLEKIEREVLRCKEIVQNLLNFSRAQDRAATARLDVNAVVEATLHVTDHALGMGTVKLEKSLTANLPSIEGNANQLQQVFTNIVINAAKAMPTGGSLTVTTEESADARAVLVTFRDTGHGMSREVASRVFEPFFTTRKVGEGTGLGLSVSYGLVKAHGGDIAVSSEQGKGTTFTVLLPAAV